MNTYKKVVKIWNQAMIDLGYGKDKFICVHHALSCGGRAKKGGILIRSYVDHQLYTVCPVSGTIALYN